MSQIARFYVLPEDRFDDLIAAATPRTVTEEKRWLFLKKRQDVIVDEYWEFTRKVARQGEDCSLAGAIFADLDLFLEPKGAKPFDLARRDLSERLSRARDTLSSLRPAKRAWPIALRHRIPVYDHAAALAALTKFEACDVTEDAARLHARENYPPEDEQAAALTLMEAFALTKRWLAAVGLDEVGVLDVG